MFAGVSADFAAGPLTMGGHTIFDQAVEVNGILEEIKLRMLAQRVPLRSALEETGEMTVSKRQG